ncbi:MAG: phosphotransferase [Myxococcota bacterium]
MIVPEAVRAAYGLAAEANQLGEGLTNETYLVRSLQSQAKLVLQSLNPVFGASVNEDIDAITTHLASAGLETQRLVRAGNGASSIRCDGKLWRVLSYVNGESHGTWDNAVALRSAGELVARVHTVLRSCEHAFASERHAHDTNAHFERLRVRMRQPHPRRQALLPLAEAIVNADVPLWNNLPRRIIHGDLKLSNVLFVDERAIALVDLDTFQWSDIAIELGDACRSWCNPRGEDVADPVFRVDLYDAALAGYIEHAPWLTAAERACLRIAPIRIGLELASRFCLDAFEEAYFRWDPTRFESASHHNEVRARGQLHLARSARTQLAD